MTAGNDSNTLIDQFRRELEQDDRQALTRARVWIGVRLVLVVFVAGYMSWMIGAISKLNATELTRIAAVSVEERIPQVRADLRDYALELAPELTDQAREMLVQAPGQVRGFVEAEVLRTTDELIGRFEHELDTALTTVLDEQLDVLRTELDGANPEEQLDTLILGVSGVFSDTVNLAVDQIYTDYSTEVATLNAHLDHLLRDDDLTEAEKIDRQLIQMWMVLVHRHDVAEPSRVLEAFTASF